MKNKTPNPFMPFKGTVKEAEDNLLHLIAMRTDTVASYGFLSPDSLYPVYVCTECGAREVSLSVLKPDTDSLQSFEDYITYLSSMAPSIPLASCNICSRSNPAAPAWIGFFTYIAEAACDLFIHIEDSKVKRAFKLHLLGDPEPIEKLENDEHFLAAFEFPFSLRWAWKKLIDAFAGKNVFQVQKIHDGYYLGIDGSGKIPDEKWQGWFASTAQTDHIDSAVIISSETCDSILDGSPSDWLEEEDLILIEENKLRLFVFYSASRYQKILKSTLLQKGINLTGDDDPQTISIDDYYLEINSFSLLRTAALTGSPNLQMLRRHLISRVELLEAIRGAGRRLSNLFEENYLVSVSEGCNLEVKDAETNKTVRSISLLECSEISTLTKDDFNELVSEQLGYKLSTNLFQAGN
jgi:hypothetical protein